MTDGRVGWKYGLLGTVGIGGADRLVAGEWCEGCMCEWRGGSAGVAARDHRVVGTARCTCAEGSGRESWCGVMWYGGMCEVTCGEVALLELDM